MIVFYSCDRYHTLYAWKGSNDAEIYGYFKKKIKVIDCQRLRDRGFMYYYINLNLCILD